MKKFYCMHDEELPFFDRCYVGECDGCPDYKEIDMPEENNIIFVGMDFVNEPRRMLKNIEDKICKDMTEDQRLAYNFGIDTVLSFIEDILNNGEDTFVHIDGLKCQEEFTIEDLMKKLEDK